MEGILSDLNKVIDTEDFVARLSDGMTIGIGGWGSRRKPMTLIRAILRSSLKDLVIVTYGGPDVGMLCAAGKVRKLVFAFVSLDVISIEPFFRKARESGLVEVLELDEGMLQWGLKAAAFRLPFLPTRVGLGTDLITYGGFANVTSPYSDGEVLLAMPALPLDVSLLHVHRADRRGNVQALGPDSYYDDWFARAAAQTFVSSEAVFDRLDLSHPEDARANIVERCFISGVVEAPAGAHPTSMPPTYGWDVDHLRTYVAAAASEDGWAKYRSGTIGEDELHYLVSVGGHEAVSRLPLAV